MKKRILSIILALVCALSLTPGIEAQAKDPNLATDSQDEIADVQDSNTFQEEFDDESTVSTTEETETQDNEKLNNKSTTINDDNTELIENKVVISDYKASGFFGDYYMVGSFQEIVEGVFSGATKFALTNDISMADLWVIDGGSNFTIRGNGHQMINNRPDAGPMILVQNGGILTTENNLILNGNYHRNNGTQMEGGSSGVDCINATFFAYDTTFCNNLNHGYLPGETNLGGGTGFNIVSENYTNSAYGLAVNCKAYNCEGAGFFVRNDDGRGATLECRNCEAYDCSWGFMVNSGFMNISDCTADASKYDGNKDGINAPHGGCGICYTGGSGIARNCESTGAFASYFLTVNAYLDNCTGSDTKNGLFACAGTANNCNFYSNHSGVNNYYGSISLSNCDIRDNSIGVLVNSVVNMSNNNVYDNAFGMIIEDTFLTFANLYIDGGSNYNNNVCDIYQNGALYMSGATSNSSDNGIYLCDGKHINVTGMLTKDSNVKLAPESNSLGRLVADCSNVSSDKVLPKLKLSFIKTTSGRKGVLRCGVGTNGAEGTIVLSEQYTVTYKANLNKSGVTEKVPSKQYFYWQEKDTLRTGQRPVLTKNGIAYTGLTFKNWNTSKFGNGFAYFNDIDLMLNDDLTLYAIYEDDVKPYGVITVTPTAWEDTNGLVTVTATDEGSGLSKIVLVRQSLVTGKRDTVATYSCNGANTKYVTYRQREEGEFIFIAYVYDMDGNVSVFTSQRMKIDKSNPQIHGLENTNTDWTNIAPIISVNATDYLYGTTYTAAGVNSVLIIDDMGNIVARGTNNATFTLTEKYEGTHTFTIRVYDNIGHETTDSVTTHYDITAPAMNGTESTRVDNSVYVQDNIIDQMIDDYYTNSRYANDSSGVKSVVLYECRNGELKEVKNSNTRKDFASPNNQNAFHEKYTIKEKDKNVEYYLLVATDFAGNKTVKKITSQRYILTLMRTSIDKSTYEL